MVAARGLGYILFLLIFVLFDFFFSFHINYANQSFSSLAKLIEREREIVRDIEGERQIREFEVDKR